MKNVGAGEQEITGIEEGKSIGKSEEHSGEKLVSQKKTVPQSTFF